MPMPHPQRMYVVSGGAVVPIMRQLPLVHGLGVDAGHEVPSP